LVHLLASGLQACCHYGFPKEDSFRFRRACKATKVLFTAAIGRPGGVKICFTEGRLTKQHNDYYAEY
jgi:hypothetical protein